MDNKWVTQYNGLFCVFNSDGIFLTWKLTKSLAFEDVDNVLIGLQKRLESQGKQIEEFYIDNCCSLRMKLQGVFGTHTKVHLDIFHAVQRVSQKMPKRHPYHSAYLHSLRMAFRDPTDQRDIRNKPTLSPDVIRQQLINIQLQWETIKHNDKPILSPAALRCLLAHADRGCLSGIFPGRGTNRNERLHRNINCHMMNSRYRVELSYALLTSLFFRHNENIDAKMEKRTPCPISALGYHEEQNCEQF